MKTTLKLIVINLIILIFSCTKDDTSELNTQMPTVVPEPMQEFYNNHKQTAQTFQINASSGGAITGTKGMNFTFPTNCFVTANGTAVTGNVDIQLKEFNTKGDFILNKVFTVSDGRPLQSAGAYELKVLQNGNELKLGTGKTYSAKMVPNYYTPQMYVYTGETSSSASVNWVLIQNASTTVTQLQIDSSSFRNIFSSSDLNYINCDHPYDSTDFTPVNGTLPDSKVAEVLAIDNNAKMAVRIYAGHTFQWNYAPTGRYLKVIAMYFENGVYHLSYVDFTNNGQAITLPAYQVKTESQMVAFIEAL